MSEKKELNNEELEKVTGGWAGDLSKYSAYTTKVDNLEFYERYLFKSTKSNNEWYFGLYTAYVINGLDKYRVHVEDAFNGAKQRELIDLTVRDWAVYKN